MKLDPSLYAAVVAALRKHRVAKYAAVECGVNPVTAWRIAKKENIDLLSLSEHQKKRLADPEYRARQIPAARKAASAWLKKMHAKPAFRRKVVEGARKNLKRLNRDPKFRAASAARLKARYQDPAFSRKQAEAAREGQLRRHAAAKSAGSGQRRKKRTIPTS